MREHCDGITEASDSRREQLGAVNKLNGAETNGPTDGVDKNGGNSGIRAGSIGRGYTAEVYR